MAMVRLQATVIPKEIADELHELLADLKADSPGSALKFADAIRFAIGRGVVVGRQELRERLQRAAKTDQRPSKRVDTEKLASTRSPRGRTDRGST